MPKSFFAWWEAVIKAMPIRCADDLETPYVPTLAEFSNPPRIEYVTRDCASVYERIDDQFSIIRDMTSLEVIGFQFII